MHAVSDVNNDYSNKSSSQLVMKQLTSNESLKIWTHCDTDSLASGRAYFKDL